MSNQTDIRNNVLEKIRSGEVTMRPRGAFLFRRIVLGAVAIFILLLSLFALSFGFFSVKAKGAQYLLSFGSQGVLTFLSLFPWTSLLLFFILIIALEFLVRRITSAYRFPILRLFSVVLLVGLAGSAILDVTPLHSSIFRAAHTGQLPALTPLYGELAAPRPEQGLYSGKIISVGSSTITISKDDSVPEDEKGDDSKSAASSMLGISQEAEEEQSWTIVPPEGASPEAFSVGEKVYVGGHEEDGVVRAYGIHMESKKGKNEQEHQEKNRGEKSDRSDRNDDDNTEDGARGRGGNERGR